MTRLTAALLLAASAAAAEPITPIGDILARKGASDKRSFCVIGTPDTVFEKVSRRGNPYFTFWIDDGTGKLKVFAFGRYPQDKKSGEPLEACGRYLKFKMVSSRAFYDELDARMILSGARMRSGLLDVVGGEIVLSSATASRLPQPPKPR